MAALTEDIKHSSHMHARMHACTHTHTQWCQQQLSFKQSVKTTDSSIKTVVAVVALAWLIMAAAMAEVLA